jgi:streptomycin 6-kinase
MNERAVQVQPMVRQRLTLLGSRGEQWLAELPDLIAHLERAWAITVRLPLAGGTASYVARARTADGQDAVLKIAIPGLQFARRLDVIARARGRGYVRLLAYDVARRAMLMEALGPSLAELALPPERTIAILCEMLRQAWDVPGPSERRVAPEDEKAAQLGRLVSRLWEELGHPCSERVMQEALRCAERRAAAFDPARCVLVHGDPHPGNALQVQGPRRGAESGFVFVDPDGFLADPAYDLGVVLRDWRQQLLTGDARALARRYCALLGSLTGIEETAIWEWGFLERVSSGLYALEFGAEELGRPLLASAEGLI